MPVEIIARIVEISPVGSVHQLLKPWNGPTKGRRGASTRGHVPNKGEQMARYYGFYSNVSRGKRKKQDENELIPYILESGGSSREYLKNRDYQSLPFSENIQR